MATKRASCTATSSRRTCSTTDGALKAGLRRGQGQGAAVRRGRRRHRHPLGGAAWHGGLPVEQARGAEVDARADLFAVGAILDELVTGRRAFDAPSAIETLHAILMHEPPPVGRPALDAVLGRCLAKAPEERVGSARALLGLLLALG